MAKPQLPPENSIPLRVMVCLMWIVAISASFFFGESPVPAANFTPMQAAALILSIWLCIGGGIYSYHYRENPPPAVHTLIKVGVGLMIVNLARELFEANMGAMQFQFIRPLMHALVASSVLTSFEMRTRPDIIQSATFGLLLLCVAAVSGKSLLFGGIVFLYICFGTALLIYSCRSQTRTDSADNERSKPIVKMLTKRNLPIASFLLFTMVPLASAAAFCVMPRMDNEADSFAAQMRTAVTSTISNWRTGGKPPEPTTMPPQRPGPNKIKVARRREEARHEAAAGQKGKKPKSDEIAAVPKDAKSKPSPSDLKVPPLEPPPNGAKSQSNATPDSESKSDSTAPKQDDESQPGKSKAPAKPGSGKSTDKGGNTKLDESKIKNDVPMTRPEDPVFSLASNRNVYTRVMAMDDFDGHTWRRSDDITKWELAPSERGVQFASIPPMGISFDTPIMELAQVYTVENDLGSYVPIAGVPQTLSLLETIHVDAYANVKAQNTLTKGTKYSVTAELPIYSLEALRKTRDAFDEPANIDQCLQIPEDQSKELFSVASEVAGTEGNRFIRAERILNHLRKNYAYSPTPMLGEDPKKNTVDVFLFGEKKGDCKAYASAFVMMCRAAEIPARFTMGYLPGDFDSITGVQHVKRKHGHAWAEAWIPPNGWVPFDATPTGTLPARPEEQYYNYQRLTKEAQKYGEKVNSTGAVVMRNTFIVFHYIMVIAAVGIAAVALFFGFRAARGLFKQMFSDIANRHPASTIKRRVIKRLRKRGLMDSPSDSGAELIAKLRETLVQQKRNEELADKFEQFIDVYNAAYFGRENRLGDLKQLESAISKLSNR